MVNDSRRYRGWYTRGYVPHCDRPRLLQFVTFRLVDSVPQCVFDEWKEELATKRGAGGRAMREIQRRIARYEDRGHGACWLSDPRVAGLVQSALLHFDRDRYALGAWCVMPNHVHAVVAPAPGFEMGSIVHSWKSFTASAINRLLGRRGAVWMREYFDRYIRDDDHLARTVDYIHLNPVSAALTRDPADWPWSSAWPEHAERLSQQPIRPWPPAEAP